MSIKQLLNGIVQIKPDAYGNPRYVFHFLHLADNYIDAKAVAKQIGAKPYRAKWYGGGFVIQSYNIQETAATIAAIKS